MKDLLKYALVAAVLGVALIVAASAAGFVGTGFADWMARFIKWDF